MLQWVKGCRPDLECVEPRFGGCSPGLEFRVQASLGSRGVAKVSS